MLPVKRADKTAVKDPSKRRAPRQEKALALAVGGRTTSASGSKTEKGDVRLKGVARIEAKCTRKRSFSVTLEMIDKIENAASMCRPAELPVIHVEFLDAHGNPIKGLYVMRQIDVEELLGEKADEVGAGTGARTRQGLTPKRRGDG